MDGPGQKPLPQPLKDFISEFASETCPTCEANRLDPNKCWHDYNSCRCDACWDYRYSMGSPHARGYVESDTSDESANAEEEEESEQEESQEEESKQEGSERDDE